MNAPAQVTLCPPALVRRRQPGVAIVTTRPAVIAARYQNLAVPFRVLLVQPGPSWPAYRPPVVLDTIGLTPTALLTLLDAVPLPPRPIVAALAIADPLDWCALRLLRLCPAIGVICPDDPALVGRWLASVVRTITASKLHRTTVWVMSPPPTLRLDPLLLPVLAALHTSTTVQAAAARTGLSESTLARLLRETKAALGLPSGEVARFRPDEVVAAILACLAIVGKERDVPPVVPRSFVVD